MRLFKKRSRSSSASLSKLASKRQWDAFLTLLATPAGQKQARSTTDFGQATLLHSVIEEDPPVEVVSALARAWPEALTLSGMVRIPLLDGAMLGASVSTMRVLVEANEATVEMKDDQGMTALHLAVWRACSSEKVDANALEVISLLCCAHPDAVDEVDNNRETPVDIAGRLGSGGKGDRIIALLRGENRRARLKKHEKVGSASTSSLDSEEESSEGCNDNRDVSELRQLMELTRKMPSRAVRSGSAKWTPAA